MMRWVCVLFLFILKGSYAMPFSNDHGSIISGAQFFTNYCAGCHSLKYVRPDRMTEYRSLMSISMPETDARQWFGRMPPDLSLIVRERGSAWLYSYLNGFYADKNQPFGTNNTVVRDVAMPDILYPLRGHVKLDDDIHDVVSFLVYVAEPTRAIRYQIGLWVILFSGFLGLLIHRLKVMYWRNIQ